MKTDLLVLFGGVSTEHEISCISASFVIDSLNKDKYNIIPMGITSDGVWYIYNGSIENIKNGKWAEDNDNLLPAILSPCSLHHGIAVFNKADKTYKIQKVDVAFPVLHGRNGEDGTVQGLLTLAGIPFVGCSSYSSAVCMDKAATKIICEQCGIQTSPFIVVRNTENFDFESFCIESEEAFGYPVFVKPANSGSSVGITKAKNREMLKDGLKEAFKHDRKVIVERNVAGKEIEVAVFGNYDKTEVCCGEVCPNADFYDYDTKYNNDSSAYYIPPHISESARKKVLETAKKVYYCLDCAGLSRVDFLVDGENVVLNEINTIPGFTSISMYPKLMMNYGKTAEELLDGLIALATEAKR